MIKRMKHRNKHRDTDALLEQVKFKEEIFVRKDQVRDNILKQIQKCKTTDMQKILKINNDEKDEYCPVWHSNINF